MKGTKVIGIGVTLIFVVLGAQNSFARTAGSSRERDDDGDRGEKNDSRETPFNTTFCNARLNGNYSYDSDCTKYYSCVNDTTAVQNCPYWIRGSIRQQFNNETNMCDWPWKSQCSVNGTTKPTSKLPGTRTTSRDTTRSTRDPDDTTKRPATTTVIPIESSTTASTSAGTNSPNETFSCEGKACGRFEDPADCSAYYICNETKTVVVHKICPPSLLFNPLLSVCDLRENVICSGIHDTVSPDTTEASGTTNTSHGPNATTSHTGRTGSTDSSHETSSSRPTHTTDRTGSTHSPHETSSSRPTHTTDRTGASHSPHTTGASAATNSPYENFSCEERDCGVYEDPDDCSAYYICNKTRTVVVRKTCPAGLLFNPEEKICDLEKNVICSGVHHSVRPGTTKASGSTDSSHRPHSTRSTRTTEFSGSSGSSRQTHSTSRSDTTHSPSSGETSRRTRSTTRSHSTSAHPASSGETSHRTHSTQSTGSDETTRRSGSTHGSFHGPTSSHPPHTAESSGTRSSTHRTGSTDATHTTLRPRNQTTHSTHTTGGPTTKVWDTTQRSINSTTSQLDGSTADSYSTTDITDEPECIKCGLFGDPTDCCRYYLCADGIRTDLRCRAKDKYGYHYIFDVVTEECRPRGNDTVCIMDLYP